MRLRGQWLALALAAGNVLVAAAGQPDSNTGWIGLDLEMSPTPTVDVPNSGDQADSADRDYSADLKRLAPTPPSKALSTFEVEPGFKLELAAAEPLVADPVAIDFDEHGRAYVVEMLGYSEDAEDMLGRIRVLDDADRDGKFDTSTVFADGLAWPTAVICYDGGVFVGAAPDILYFKDADGDGRAEVRRVVFTGFGTDNVQGLLNSFRWGLDNRIHVAVSRCGADLRPGDNPDGEPLLVLRGRNFAFDPKTLEVEATSGASQHGLTFDPWGNAFTCHNSDHIQQIVMEDRYLSRNPHMRPPSPLVSIAMEGPAADVFRISPVEPWREIRTRLRAKGIVPGVVEGGGRAAGYFTSATGVTIYTGDAWPEEFHGNAFIGDVGSNLVHRKIIERKPNAIPFVARRATSGREFIASTDTWFRPVQFANAPDGNLYVLDMYREVIEHPASLPPVIKKHLDLTSGRDRGRIYRVVWESLRGDARQEQFSRALPGDASTEELVAMLAHSNGWHRTTAARLLFERNDPAAIPFLQSLFRSEARSSGRLLAIHLLSSFTQLDFETLQIGLADADARIRAQVVRLAAPRLADRSSGPHSAPPQLRKILQALVDDPDIHVRFQAASALRSARNPSGVAALASIVRRDAGDKYMQAVVFSSLARGADLMLHELLASSDFADSDAGCTFLLELCRQIGARGDSVELAAAASELTALNDNNPELAGDLVASIVQGGGAKSAAVRKQLAAASDGKTNDIVVALVDRSLRVAVDEEASTAERVSALAPLSLAAIDDVGPALTELLSPRHPQEVQSKSIVTLIGFGAQAVPAVLDVWPGMGPQLRSQAAGLMLARRDSALELIKALETGKVSPRDLDPSTAQQMKTHADETVRKLSVKLLDAAAPKREEVVSAHLDVLDLTGDAERGREVFRKNCAICHKKEDHGTEVGADLATVVTRTPEALLISVLDPNREVDPKYLQYTVLTVDGLAKSGMIAGETATSVTLKREQNATETIPRAEIETLESTGMTLMPEGFEKTIDKQSLADLIAYLRQP